MFRFFFSHSPRVSSWTGYVLRAILVPNWSLAHSDVTTLIFSVGPSPWRSRKGGSGESPPPGHFKNFSIFQENWPFYRFFGTNRFVSTPLWRIRGYFGIFIIFWRVGAYEGGGLGVFPTDIFLNLDILRYIWYQTITIYTLFTNLIIFIQKYEFLTEFEHKREGGGVWGRVPLFFYLGRAGSRWFLYFLENENKNLEYSYLHPDLIHDAFFTINIKFKAGWAASG